LALGERAGFDAHMLRHGCGYVLANAGHDTRAIRDWLGHRSIQHTVRYTELGPGLGGLERGNCQQGGPMLEFCFPLSRLSDSLSTGISPITCLDAAVMPITEIGLAWMYANKKEIKNPDPGSTPSS
jgi:hypothetical protein